MHSISHANEMLSTDDGASDKPGAVHCLFLSMAGSGRRPATRWHGRAAFSPIDTQPRPVFRAFFDPPPDGTPRVWGRTFPQVRTASPKAAVTAARRPRLAMESATSGEVVPEHISVWPLPIGDRTGSCNSCWPSIRRSSAWFISGGLDRQSANPPSCSQGISKVPGGIGGRASSCTGGEAAIGARQAFPGTRGRAAGPLSLKTTVTLTPSAVVPALRCGHDAQRYSGHSALVSQSRP